MSAVISHRLHFSPIDASLRLETPDVLYRGPMDPITVQEGDESIFVDVEEPTGDELPTQEDIFGAATNTRRESPESPSPSPSAVTIVNEHVEQEQVSVGNENNGVNTAASVSVVEESVNVKDTPAEPADQDEHQASVQSAVRNPCYEGSSSGFGRPARKYDTCGPNRSPGCGCRECISVYGGQPPIYSDESSGDEAQYENPSSPPDSPLISSKASSDNEDDCEVSQTAKRKSIESRPPAKRIILEDDSGSDIIYCGAYKYDWKINVDKTHRNKDSIKIVKVLVRTLPPIPHPTEDLDASQMGFGPDFQPLSPTSEWAKYGRSCGRIPNKKAEKN